MVLSLIMAQKLRVISNYLSITKHSHAHTHLLTHTQRRRRRIWRRWWLTWGRGEAGGEIGDSRLASFLTILQLLDSKFQIPGSSRFKRWAGILDSGVCFWAAIRRQPLEESWLLPCWALGNYRTSCPDCFMEESSHDRFPPPSLARKSFLWLYLSAWSGVLGFKKFDNSRPEADKPSHSLTCHCFISYFLWNKGRFALPGGHFFAPLAPPLPWHCWGRLHFSSETEKM